MDIQLWIALIVATPAMITAMVAVYQAARQSGRAEEYKRQSEQTIETMAKESDEAKLTMKELTKQHDIDRDTILELKNRIYVIEYMGQNRDD